ncbi:MAG: hypothetical protein KGJ94_06940 [Xanthomonadaceae bacterium]|nr:hypothetical protein [Xanthomonadaceae bacterium]
MAFIETMEITMESTVCKAPSLKLVGGEGDEKNTAVRQYCAKLMANLERYSSGTEKSLQPGTLAQWKPGMKNRTSPAYGAPVIVVEVLDPPIIDTKFDSGSVYFREPLDLVLGFVDEDDEFYTLYYDSHRFEPYTGVGWEGHGVKGA